MTAIAVVNSMILASAGTGKTFELSNRYIRLLLDGAHPKSILATTFTRKAAGEILDRIVSRLAKAAADPMIAKATASELAAPETTQEQFGEVLNSLVRNLNNLQVETLDAFFYKIAQAFSLDMGLAPGWEIADDSESRGLKNRAIRNSLTRRTTVNIVHDLAKGEAKRGISNMIRGTVSELYEIFRESHDTGRLHAWSALQEMPLLADAEIEKLHQQLRHLEIDGTAAFKSKVEDDLVRIENREWNTLLTKGICSKVAEGLTVFNRKELPPEFLALMLPIAKHAVALNINLLVKQTQGAFEFLKSYHTEFHSLKTDNGVLEFNDVAYYASLLFSRYNFARLAWRLDQNIDHLLLDEFQDTSIQQWQVLKPLAERVCQKGEQRSFFCVGDVKQAIYGWRGGVAEIFDEVRNQFADSLDHEPTRSKSYRSSPVIIDTVNLIFENIASSKVLKDQKPMFQSWLDRFKEHETARTNLAGCVTFETTHNDKTHTAEVAARIKQVAEEFPNRTIGVLTRTNADVAKLIFELGLAGVAASEEGGNPLTDSAAVNILISALRLLDHPDDAISRFHVMHSPLADAFQLTPENFKKANHPLRQLTQEMRLKLIGNGYGDLLAEWAKLLAPKCTAREWFRVGQLIEKGYSVSTVDHLRTSDIVRWIENEKVADPSSAQVNVMTLHKSKGLEFDIVFLPELDFDRGGEPTYIVGRESATKPIDFVCRYMDKTRRGWLPIEFQGAFDNQREKDIHEFLCMIYVAITRAKHALHMIATHNSHAGKKSAAGLIMSSLGIDHHPKNNPKPGQILWSATKGEWGPDKTKRPDKSAKTKNHLGAIRFAPSTTNRNLPWESPSSREGGNMVRLGRLLQLEDNRDARLAGSLIHCCFEQIDWLEDGPPHDALLQDKLRNIDGATQPDIKSAISSFRKMLKRPNTSNLLQREQFGSDLFNSYDDYEVQNERAFTVRVDDAILNGFIDRLVLLKRGGKIVAADVVDFKTDALPANDQTALRQRVDVYKPQIRGYRDAVAAIFGLPIEDVSARLMFVAIDQQVPIR